VGRTGDAEITGVAVGTGTYTLAETPTESSAGTEGYVTTGWECDSVAPVQGSGETATLTLGTDDVDVTCTIENTWRGGTLTLAKRVSGGPAAPGDWMLSATPEGDGTAIEGSTGSATVTAAPVLAGSYALAEAPARDEGAVTLYAPGEWSCAGGVLRDGVVRVAQGADVVCEVTNVYDPATLTLVKEVVGGEATPADWEPGADGPTTHRGVTGAAGVTAAPVGPGAYSLSESAVGGDVAEGYSTQGWRCVGASVADGVVRIVRGADVTCTVTNVAAGVPPLGPGPVDPGPADPGPVDAGGGGAGAPDGALAVTGADPRAALAPALGLVALGLVLLGAARAPAWRSRARRP